MVYKQNELLPTAKIAVNKNLIKVYNEEQVYLKDKQHFQIELYNPLSTEVLAVIKINNESIGNTGVVLRPAERVFLDRYLDKPRKFQFSTYFASGSKEQIEYATQDNGVVEVNFFKKEEIINLGANINYYSTPLGLGNGTGDFLPNPTFTTCSSATFDSLSCTNASIENASYTGPAVRGANKKNLKSKKVETGRINEGEVSKQKFTTVDMTFESLPCSTEKYKLLPQSQKVHNVKEIHQTKQYCTECGSRIRKKQSKFCWNCGERL